MTTRRKKIALRAYDYMAGHKLVRERLLSQGETGLLDSTEKSMVDVAIEIAAEKGVTTEVAEAMMVEVAEQIIRDRKRTLFTPFDERDNMGDETVSETMAKEVAA